MRWRKPSAAERRQILRERHVAMLAWQRVRDWGWSWERAWGEPEPEYVVIDGRRIKLASPPPNTSYTPEVAPVRQHAVLELDGQRVTLRQAALLCGKTHGGIYHHLGKKPIAEVLGIHPSRIRIITWGDIACVKR